MSERPVGVMTLEGPIDPAELGITLTHEHLLIDLSHLHPTAGSNVVGRERHLSIAELGAIRRDPLASRSNLVLEDKDLAVAEIGEFHKLGGRSIVELTTVGIGQDRMGLLAISRRAGVHVIAGCGFYTASTHPGWVARMDAETLADTLVRDIVDGDANGLKPGAIGEIGTSDPILESEWLVLRAACVAHRATGLPLFVHVAPTGDTAPEVVRFVVAQGVDPSRLVVCHLLGRRTLDYHLEVARMGANLGYDSFGLDAYFESGGPDAWTSDTAREPILLHMLEHGYGSQVMLSHDVCMKFQLRAYGGFGYAHLLTSIIPRLASRGVSQTEIDQLLIDNPGRLLTPRS